jgi:hypothetical protein
MFFCSKNVRVFAVAEVSTVLSTKFISRIFYKGLQRNKNILMLNYLIRFIKCSTIICILAFQSNYLFAASDLVNIKACVERAKQYSGIDLNSAPLNYNNNWIAKDVVTWANAECKVSSETVNDLVINKEIVIIDEYAGVAAFNLNEYISDVVKRSNTTLENRLNKGNEVNKLNIRYKTLTDKRYNLREEKWDADKRISDAEERTKNSDVLNRNDEKTIRAAQDNINKINDELNKLQNELDKLQIEFDSLNEVKGFKKRKSLLDKIKNKTNELLKLPYPDIEKITIFSKNNINKILKKNEADTTDYFASFHKESSVDDALQSLESEIENL